MKAHTSRRSSAKLLVAAVAASAAITIVSADAAIGTPQMTGTSVKHGFNKDPFTVAAAYNLAIDPGSSSVTVVKNDGVTLVNGSDFVDLLVDNKVLQFRTLQDDAFNGIDSPYTATFTTRAVNQQAGTPDSVETVTFDVDVVIPFVPNVKLNDGPQSVAVVGDLPQVSGPTDPLVINGYAEDILDDGIASGIAEVMVHFYQPEVRYNTSFPGTPPQVYTGEISAKRITITYPCDPTCNIKETLAIDLSSLTTGYWTIRVSTTDGAGNRSSQSEPMSVLKLAP